MVKTDNRRLVMPSLKKVLFALLAAVLVAAVAAATPQQASAAGKACSGTHIPEVVIELW